MTGDGYRPAGTRPHIQLSDNYKLLSEIGLKCCVIFFGQYGLVKVGGKAVFLQKFLGLRRKESGIGKTSYQRETAVFLNLFQDAGAFPAEAEEAGTGNAKGPPADRDVVPGNIQQDMQESPTNAAVRQFFCL